MGKTGFFVGYAQSPTVRNTALIHYIIAYRPTLYAILIIKTIRRQSQSSLRVSQNAKTKRSTLLRRRRARIGPNSSRRSRCVGLSLTLERGRYRRRRAALFTVRPAYCFQNIIALSSLCGRARQAINSRNAGSFKIASPPTRKPAP